MMMWRNSSGEDRLLVFDTRGRLHEFDPDYSLSFISTETIKSISKRCDYVVIGNYDNSVTDFDVVTNDIIYIVYSYDKTNPVSYLSTTYHFVVYNMSSRNTLQNFTVIDTSSSYSPNAPTLMFVDQKNWILYLYGIRAVLKFRINSTTFEFKSSTPYRVDHLGLTSESAGEESGPACFSPPSILVGEGPDDLTEPNVYRTFSIAHNEFCDVNIGIEGCDTTLYSISFYSCSFGYFVDNVTMTDTSHISATYTYDLPNGTDLCQRTPPGYFSPEIDSASLSTCPFGQFPEKLSSSFECTTCNVGYFADSVIANSSYCQKCPEGTYSSTSGIISLESCVPCPVNTYGPQKAATSVSFCLSCGEEDEYFCGTGATQRIERSMVSTATKYPKLELSDTSPSSDWIGDFLQKLMIVGIIAGSAVTAFFFLFHVCCIWDTTKDCFEFLSLPCVCIYGRKPFNRKKIVLFHSSSSEHVKRKKRNVVRFTRAFSNVWDCFRSFRRFDIFFSLQHDVNEKESPVKQKTGCGGVISFISLTIFCVLLTFTILDFTDGYKEDVTTTKLYFQDGEMKNHVGTYSFYYIIYGLFEECEAQENKTTNSGFSVQKESKTCHSFQVGDDDDDGILGCRCDWVCESCSIVFYQLSVSFDFMTDGKYVSYVQYGISVPHYIQDESFDLESGVSHLNPDADETIQSIDIEVALFRSEFVSISSWSLLVDFLPVSNRSGLSMSQLSSKKTTSSVLDAKKQFTIRMNLQLSNLQFIIQETLRLSVLGVVSQTFALFSLSVAIGGFIFGFADGYSSLEKICRFCLCCKIITRRCRRCPFLKKKVGEDDDDDSQDDDDDGIRTRRGTKIRDGYDNKRKKRREKGGKLLISEEEIMLNMFDRENEELDLVGVLEDAMSRKALNMMTRNDGESDGSGSDNEYCVNNQLDEEMKVCKTQIRSLLYVCKKIVEIVEQRKNQNVNDSDSECSNSIEYRK